MNTVSRAIVKKCIRDLREQNVTEGAKESPDQEAIKQNRKIILLLHMELSKDEMDKELNDNG